MSSTEGIPYYGNAATSNQIKKTDTSTARARTSSTGPAISLLARFSCSRKHKWPCSPTPPCRLADLLPFLFVVPANPGTPLKFLASPHSASGGDLTARRGLSPQRGNDSARTMVMVSRKALFQKWPWANPYQQRRAHNVAATSPSVGGGEASGGPSMNAAAATARSLHSIQNGQLRDRHLQRRYALCFLLLSMVGLVQGRSCSRGAFTLQPTPSSEPSGSSELAAVATSPAMVSTL